MGSYCINVKKAGAAPFFVLDSAPPGVRASSISRRFLVALQAVVPPQLTKKAERIYSACTYNEDMTTTVNKLCIRKNRNCSFPISGTAGHFAPNQHTRQLFHSGPSSTSFQSVLTAVLRPPLGHSHNIQLARVLAGLS